MNLLAKSKYLKRFRYLSRCMRHPVILGIEASCDDTGVAVVTHPPKILGEVVFSQQLNSNRFGGVNPTIAEHAHKKNLPKALDDVLRQCGFDDWNSVDAIAVTTRPGGLVGLRAAAKCAVELAAKYQKPIIPIHHMEAHALTIRLTDPSVPFPYLCLLISGGHCQLIWVEGATQFRLLGSSVDTAPGEVLDKVSRRLRLYHIGPEWERLSGGAAIERMAEQGSPLWRPFPAAWDGNLDCDFSFELVKYCALGWIYEMEAEHEIPSGNRIPRIEDFCACLQGAIAAILSQKVQRAFEYLKVKGLCHGPSNIFVLSGGVASNKCIRQRLAHVAAMYGFQLKCPPPRLCTDNGAMIAWNGIERWRCDEGVIQPGDIPTALTIYGDAPFGHSWQDDVRGKKITLPDRNYFATAPL